MFSTSRAIWRHFPDLLSPPRFLTILPFPPPPPNTFGLAWFNQAIPCGKLKEGGFSDLFLFSFSNFNLFWFFFFFFVCGSNPKFLIQFPRIPKMFGDSHPLFSLQTPQVTTIQRESGGKGRGGRVAKRFSFS